MSKTTTNGALSQPDERPACTCTITAVGTPDEARILNRECPQHVETTLNGGFVLNDVWKVDPDDEVAYLARPIEHDEQILVCPRLYVEVRAHGNAEPMILTADEADEMARVIAAAAAMVRRGEGYAR